jgi:hypothetical protein
MSLTLSTWLQIWKTLTDNTAENIKISVKEMAEAAYHAL